MFCDDVIKGSVIQVYNLIGHPTHPNRLGILLDLRNGEGMSKIKVAYYSFEGRNGPNFFKMFRMFTFLLLPFVTASNQMSYATLEPKNK